MCVYCASVSWMSCLCDLSASAVFLPSFAAKSQIKHPSIAGEGGRSPAVFHHSIPDWANTHTVNQSVSQECFGWNSFGNCFESMSQRYFNIHSSNNCRHDNFDFHYICARSWRCAAHLFIVSMRFEVVIEQPCKSLIICEKTHSKQLRTDLPSFRWFLEADFFVLLSEHSSTFQ